MKENDAPQSYTFEEAEQGFQDRGGAGLPMDFGYDEHECARLFHNEHEAFCAGVIMGQRQATEALQQWLDQKKEIHS